MTEEDVLENEVKHYVFVKDGRRHFDPQYLTAGETTVEWIFPAPEPNAVGTLDEHNNGIVFIKFGDYGKEPECNIIAQNFSKTVFGSFYYRFCPNFSEDTIVYSKTGVAVIANVKTGEAFHAKCGLPIGDFMLGIRFLDTQNNLFVIVKSIDEGNNGYSNYLHIVKLDGQRLVDTGWSVHIDKTDHISPDFPLYHTWVVHDRQLFVYDHGKMLCTDGSQTVPHPFSELFNENFQRIGIVKDFAIHPTLPFAIVFQENTPHYPVILRWDITEPKKMDELTITFCQDFELLKSLFGMEHMTLAYQSFSPDENWYVAGCIAPDMPKSPYFVAIPVVPVDKKHPNFLDTDNIVVLGQVKGMTSIAWTAEPVSYVVSDGKILHKWDLDELPNARIFVMPDDDGKQKTPILGKIGRLLGKGTKSPAFLQKP